MPYTLKSKTKNISCWYIIQRNIQNMHIIHLISHVFLLYRSNEIVNFNDGTHSFLEKSHKQVVTAHFINMFSWYLVFFIN